MTVKFEGNLYVGPVNISIFFDNANPLILVAHIAIYTFMSRCQSFPSILIDQ